MKIYHSNLKKIQSFFTQGHSRTLKAKKNIIASLVLKGCSILVSFLLVPLLIHYVDKTRYGIWLTLSSFLFWFNFFEVGLGVGLKNKLAEAFAKNDTQLAKEYISSTYALISIVIIGVAVLFFSTLPLLNWVTILSAPIEMQKELFYLSLVVFGAFFLRFILKLISQVLQADQRTGLANAIFPAGNIVSLIIIFILTKYTNGNLLYLGSVLSLSPIVILTIFTIYLFRHDYLEIAPSIKSVNLKRGVELLHLGWKFFIIQIAGIILYQTANIIIIQLLGPEDVTIYHVANKYFGITAMIFTIVTMPFWPAFTEAWIKKDLKWIQRIIKKLQLQWLGLVLLSLILLTFYKPLISLWVGDSIYISPLLAILLTLFFILKSYIAIFYMFINGVGKIKMQLIFSVLGSSLFIPLSIILIKTFHLGLEGIALASIICISCGVILAPIQYKKIMFGSAKGLWGQ